MKKLLLLCLTTLLAVATWAYDFVDNGIYYNVTSETNMYCEVTYASSSYDSYSGSVVVPETATNGSVTYTVTSIGKSAFRNSTDLTEVTIGEKVTTIDNYAFKDCTALTKVGVGENVLFVNSYAFDGCIALEDIALPSGLLTLGVGAFNACTKLKEITLSDNLTSIGTTTFYGCSSLQSITIPDKVTSIGLYAFQDCTGLITVTMGKAIVTIDNYAFAGCTSLQSITIPDKVTTIGTYAFQNCTSLTTLILGKGLTTIGNYAFTGCTSLQAVSIPNATTSIGTYVFQNCTDLQDVTIGSGISSLGNYDFDGCSSIVNLTFKEGLTTIGQYSFRNCTSLKEVHFPESLTTINAYAFYGCTSLTDVTMYDNVLYIYTYAFWNCPISEIRFSESLTRIQDEAFYNACFVKLEIPNSVTSLSGFHNCQYLESVKMSENITQIGGQAFYRCTNLKGIIDTGKVTDINYYAFAECPNIEEVILPATTGTNGGEIWDDCFQNCTGMKKLTCLATTPPYLEWQIFDGMKLDSCILVVPEEAIEAYSTASQWQDFENIVAATESKATTLGATEITYNSATINGEVTLGTLTLKEQGFEYWTSKDDIHTIVADDAMSIALTDLEENTTYTYRAYVVNYGTNTTVYGEENTFTTAPFLTPTVKTYAATVVTSNSALVRGYVEAGTEEITGQGFEYWESDNADDVLTIVSDDEVMAIILNNLYPETTYTYRAYATTESGMTYGDELTFTTEEDTTTGINGVGIDGSNIADYYTIGGQKLLAPQKGINIVRFTDGTIKKVLVK